MGPGGLCNAESLRPYADVLAEADTRRFCAGPQRETGRTANKESDDAGGPQALRAWLRCADPNAGNSKPVPQAKKLETFTPP